MVGLQCLTSRQNLKKKKKKYLYSQCLEVMDKAWHLFHRLAERFNEERAFKFKCVRMQEK